MKNTKANFKSRAVKLILAICGAILLALGGMFLLSNKTVSKSDINSTVFAAPAQIGDSSTTWEYDSTTKTLTIGGTGDMPDFNGSGDTPWFSHMAEVEHIVIENGVTKIGNYSFYLSTIGRREIDSIVVGDGVVSIGTLAFRSCHFDSVSIGAGLAKEYGTYILSSNGTLTIKSMTDNPAWYTARVSELVKSVVWKEGVTFTSIGEYAFLLCSSLDEITIPDSVTSIGKSAFSTCGFSSVHIGTGLAREYDAYILASDGTLTIKSMTDNPAWYSANINPLVTSVVWKEGVTFTTIGSYSFIGCYSIKNISIPESVTIIGKAAFDYCWLLKEVKLPSGLTSLGEYAFDDCDNLTKVDLPSGVSSLSRAVFSNCYNLKTVVVRNTSATIGQYALYRCNRLESIYVPDDRVSYYKSASGWSTYASKIKALSTMPIEATFDGLNYEVTNNQAKITGYTNAISANITIPASITIDSTSYPVAEIKASSFANCATLQSVVVNAETPITFGANVFSGCSLLEAIYVPDNAVNTYKSASGWSTYASKIKGISEIPHQVGELVYTIQNNQATIVGFDDGIESDLVIPENVTIENVQYPVVAIANGAFNGANLESVTFTSAEPITMGTNVFGANSGVSIIVPNGAGSAYQTAWSAYSGQIEELPETGVALNLSILLVTLVLGGALIAVAFKRKEQL